MISDSLAASLSEWKFSISDLPNTPTIIVLLTASVVALLWTYKRLEHLPKRRQRLGFTVLRAITLVIALALLTQPVLIHTVAKPTVGDFHVLVDVSHSMNHGEDQSRLAAAQQLVANAFEQDDQFALKHRIHWHRFADVLAEVESLEQAFLPDGNNMATQLEAVVSEAITQRADKKSLGALLISDGASTAELSPEERQSFQARLQSSPVPINVLAATDADTKNDIAIVSAKVDSFAFSRSPTPIEVVLGSSGIEDREVEVLLWQSGAVLQTQRVALLGGRARARFEITPRKLGKHILTVTVPTGPDDQIPENNVAHVVFDVMQDKLRILHVAGSPSWDQRFLRDVLKEWPRIDLLSFYVLRTEYQSTTQGSSGLSLIPFPTEEVFGDHLGEFDVIVFQNFEPAAVGVDRYLDPIAEYVEGGGALVLISGPQALAGRSLSGSKLKALLPAQLPPSTRDAKKNISTDPFVAKLTAQGNTHPVTRFFKQQQENTKAWQNSTKLDGIIVSGSMRKDAVVLAEHPFLRGGKRQLPLIAIASAGRGRVLTLNTDSLWKWRFSGPMRGREADMYTRFWHNTIAWLTRDPSLDRLTVTATPPQVSSEQDVAIDIQLFDEIYAPKANESVSCTISFTDSDGQPAQEVLQAGLDAEGKSRIKWTPHRDGPHLVQVQSIDGQQATTQFLVQSTGNELAHMEPDPDQLQQIAERSGGVVYQNRFELSSLVLNAKNEPRILEREEMPLWNHPATLLLLVLLLAGEWYLRRKAGLR